MRSLKTAMNCSNSGLAAPERVPPSGVLPTSGDPWWLQLSRPFAEAGASRLAHGRTPQFGFDYNRSYSYSGLPGASGAYGYGAGGYPSSFGIGGMMGGLSSYTPLIVLALGAFLLMRR